VLRGGLLHPARPSTEGGHMRVISQYTNHVVQIRPQRQRSLGDGSIEILQDPIYAVFTPTQQGGFLYENEKDEAERHFSFRGRTQHEDEATPTDVIDRLSIYDTDEEAEKQGWDAETKALVEDTFTRKAVSSPNAILIISSTPIPSPFPNYDTYTGTPEELVIMLVEQGHDLERVLHYERTFGPKRQEIIEALEAGVEAWKEVTVGA
jgi:hypothetical protein